MTGLTPNTRLCKSKTNLGYRQYQCRPQGTGKYKINMLGELLPSYSRSYDSKCNVRQSVVPQEYAIFLYMYVIMQFVILKLNLQILSVILKGVLTLGER